MANTVSDTLNIRRLLLFMRLEIATHYKIILVFAAAAASVLFLYGLLFPMLLPIRPVSENFHPVIYFLLLYAGGFWLSSISLKDIHDDKKSYLFLTLPLSNFEKFLSKLILTSVGYVVALSLGFFVLSVIIGGVNVLLFKYPLSFFNPFDMTVLSYIRWYLVWQAVFFLGSIYFTKNAFSKIILTMSLMLIMVLIVAFVFSLLFIGPRAFFSISFNHPSLYIIKTVFWVGVMPLCWVITYLRLTKAEL